LRSVAIAEFAHVFGFRPAMVRSEMLRRLSQRLAHETAGRNLFSLDAAAHPQRIEGAMKKVQVFVPIVTPSLVNLREHWSKRHRRTKMQRTAVRLMLLCARLELRDLMRAQGLQVELVRHLQTDRPLDDDNLRSALKGVRDEVAAFFQHDDGSDFWVWRYDQSPGPVGVSIGIAELLP
jgi:hypothetical protein